nr:mechanosensitive ion channel domain-containing protein [Solimonas terrae]
MLVNFVCNVLYGLALALIVISTLAQLGVDTTSAAAVLGGMAIAVGMALQGQLSSFASGVLLIVFRPFRAGDFVQIGGTMGTVEQLKIVITVLKSPDGQEVTLPNSSVWGNTITNFSIRPVRRVDLAVGIGYGADLRKAKAILETLLAEEPRFVDEPARTVHCTNLGESSVDFAVRGWTKGGDWWDTRCAMIEKIKLRFDEEGIEIPFPQMDLHVRDLPPETSPERRAA